MNMKIHVADVLIPLVFVLSAGGRFKCFATKIRRFVRHPIVKMIVGVTLLIQNFKRLKSLISQ
jgi:hypothetical protein